MSYKNTKTGAVGEQIAKEYLIKKGYVIIASNWRAQHKEIDIIAKNKDVLVFVEVKTRRNATFGFPEEAVTPKKRQLLFQAALAFIEQYTSYSNIQFDIISVALKNKKMKDSETEIVHYEDAFYGNN
jgi:putative endonuclease